MKIRKVINRKVRRSGKGVNVVADVNAVIAGTVGEKGSTSTVRSKRSIRIVQRDGQTEIEESED
jgi:hypothetical protein